ncbi:hypothetical protein ABI_02630 [Asticcacaulis biprosthecium C19]|uniref:Uncharacterized protein n=1 Tax=Asticcacaulis biprosthecium C19 TaxID=715226 RepID=F4QIS2_9CAUL|nr:hypothetical protein [Asticcacaulis biprosthecium]EGF91831.1 hypothetical protein ABI_02630 [Asticcacaulis biprosthecium C19]
MSSSGRNQVHYEVFSRKTPASSWVLQMATEDRALALQNAEDMMPHSAGVKVNKEMMDAGTGEFSSATIFNKGAPEAKRKVKLAPETDTICVTPQDLYNLHAREKIARLLEDWLKRNQITPFELLHRPDLVEKLDASGTELQHVVQKLAIPESQETGQDLHDLMRRWRALIDRACTRVIEDGRRKVFPEVDAANFLAVVDKLDDHGERAYVLGGGICKFIAKTANSGPAAKLGALLTLGKQLSEDLGGREWALQVLEVPVSELFGTRTSMNELLGYEADLGDAMAVMTRMAAGPAVDLIAKIDPRVGKMIPPLTGALAGYHELMAKDCFPHLSQNISKRLMTELKGPRRLKPGNPEAEIETLRALALCLTAAGKEQHERDDIKEAFIERSKMLVSTDFVESLTRSGKTSAEEVERLIWLCENVVGASNKRQAARWVISAVGALKFERDMRDTNTSAAHRLQLLAHMQRRIKNAALMEKDTEEACTKLGQVGGMIAQDVQLIPHLLRAPGGPVQKLTLLLGFASGMAAPLGSVSDQAKTEAMKLFRMPELRQMLGENPNALAELKPMMVAAGMAA